MDRRALLVRLLGGLAFAAPLGGLLATAPSGAGALGGRLLSLVGDEAVARALGRRYLASLPDATALAGAMDRLRALAPKDGAALRSAVAAAAADLAAGEVVVVAGWVLARAEAEALALIALT
jgi:hypothetical protein